MRPRLVGSFHRRSGVDLKDFAFDNAGTSLYIVFDSTFTPAGDDVHAARRRLLERRVVQQGVRRRGRGYRSRPRARRPRGPAERQPPPLVRRLRVDRAAFPSTTEDVLEYAIAGGTWQMAYDGSAAQASGWPAADLAPVAACATPARPPLSFDMSICQGERSSSSR